MLKVLRRRVVVDDRRLWNGHVSRLGSQMGPTPADSNAVVTVLSNGQAPCNPLANPVHQSVLDKSITNQLAAQTHTFNALRFREDPP